jgi:hypothetical protein
VNTPQRPAETPAEQVLGPAILTAQLHHDVEELLALVRNKSWLFQDLGTGDPDVRAAWDRIEDPADRVQQSYVLAKTARRSPRIIRALPGGGR